MPLYFVKDRRRDRGHVDQADQEAATLNYLRKRAIIDADTRGSAHHRASLGQ